MLLLLFPPDGKEAKRLKRPHDGNAEEVSCRTGPASGVLESSTSDTNPSNLSWPANSGLLTSSRTEQQPMPHDPTYTSPRHPSDARHEQTRRQERPKRGVIPPQQKAASTDTALDKETPSCTSPVGKARLYQTGWRPADAKPSKEITHHMITPLPASLTLAVQCLRRKSALPFLSGLHVARKTEHP